MPAPAPSWTPPPCECEYAFPHGAERAEALWRRFPAPVGYRRVSAEPNGFACWLRGLPLKSPTAPVLLYDGTRKSYQSACAAILDIDVGESDLQQCADAVVRLRAEYLFSRELDSRIEFSATNGQLLSYARWKRGERPVLRGSRIVWSRSGSPGRSWRSFRAFLDFVFGYAGTISLKRDTKAIPVDQVQAGDLLVQAGSPGHAVIVLDTCQAQDGKGKLALLAQGFMPAQSLHVLRNLADSELSPWYDPAASEEVVTPQWTFKRGDLRRFR